jgi:hypothetical protein
MIDFGSAKFIFARLSGELITEALDQQPDAVSKPFGRQEAQEAPSAALKSAVASSFQ